MPAILANARHFVKNSDYPEDKVIVLRSGSATATTGASTITVPHGLPFAPLPGGSWSTASDFSIGYDYYAGTFPSGNVGFTFGLQVDVEANATNFILNCTNVTGSNKTVHYRLFGFEPTSSAADLPATVSQGDNFAYNSDYNLPKLWLADYRDHGAVGGSPESELITHGLGFVPQVLTWSEVSGTIKPMSWATPGGTIAPSPRITDTSLTIFIPPFSLAGRYHYRIYADE